MNQGPLKKIGFWSVFALVTGSQIGSSVFTTPTHVAGFGIYAILGFVIAALGAMALGWVFSQLCAQYPNTGGPVVYAEAEFGKHLAFFTGWTYWVISWVSSTAVVITAVGYLQAFLGGEYAPSTTLYTQWLLLTAITLINMTGVHVAGRLETILSALKIIPLLLLPCIAFFFFNSEYFYFTYPTNPAPLESMGHVAILALWGFIGLEVATTPAGSVHNPRKTIPQAILWGTACVGVLYILNVVGLMGAVPPEELAHSTAPYVTLCQYLFPGPAYKVMALIASVVCVGTLNAWILSSGQMALGLAEQKFLPPGLAKTSRHGAPIYAVFWSTIGLFPILWLTYEGSFVSQLRLVIDVSVIAFVFVYMISCLAFLKMAQRLGLALYQKALGMAAFLFCAWILYTVDLSLMAGAFSFVISGVIFYIPWLKKRGF